MRSYLPLVALGGAQPRPWRSIGLTSGSDRVLAETSGTLAGGRPWSEAFMPVRFISVDQRPDLGATRTAYDSVAADYARLLPDLGVETGLDRAMLETFADLVAAAGLGPVADVGCGTGRITAHLHS